MSEYLSLYTTALLNSQPWLVKRWRIICLTTRFIYLCTYDRCHSNSSSLSVQNLVSDSLSELGFESVNLFHIPLTQWVIFLKSANHFFQNQDSLHSFAVSHSLIELILLLNGSVFGSVNLLVMTGIRSSVSQYFSLLNEGTTVCSCYNIHGVFSMMFHHSKCSYKQYDV